jgi:hypothetical protein
VTAADPEAAYFQAVEEFFVSKRGDPLFLSNADWLLVKRWRTQGTPLRIVMRGIEDALDAHAHSWSRARKVASLRYCEAEVERARERWETALGSEGEDGTGGLAPGLRALAAAIAQAKLGSAARAVASSLARRLEDAALDPSARPRDVEPWLQEAEAEMVAAFGADVPEEAAEVAAQVDAALGAYRARLPKKVFESLREQSCRREILARHGLPRLSLFEL